MNDRVHELKIWPNYFGAILSGHKLFELRQDDRGFQCGDVLELKEWDPVTGEYSGSFTFRQVTFILHSHPGLGVGYVVMGLGPA